MSVRGPLNSSDIQEAQPVGGVFNAQPPAPLDGQGCALQLDADGNLLVNVAVGVVGGGGGSSIVQIEDSSGNPLNSNGEGALQVAIVSGELSSVTVTQSTGTNLHTVLDSGVLTSITNALPAGTNVIGHVISDTGSVVAVSNFPATQPVSGTVSVSNFPTSQAVTGTFWQATQPVSGTVTANAGTGNFAVVQPTGTNLHVVVDSAPTTAVTGTFWQATQPVSGTVAVSNFPASQAVTGTFWQATQPVSGTIAATQSGTWNIGSITTLPAITIAAAQTIAVTNTGTFATQVTNFPATQPVSGTVAVSNFPSSQVVTLASTTITGSVAVTGTFFQATQPISGTVAVSNFPASQAVTGTFWQATQPISGAISFTVPQHVVIDSGTAITATVTGTLTNNNAAPAANNMGVLSALANAAAPTWTEGDQVLLSTDLAGNLRVNAAQWGGASATGGTGTVTNGSPRVSLATNVPLPAGTNLIGAVNLSQTAGVALGATAVVAYGSTPAAANVPGVNAFITNTPAVTLASTTITGNVTVVQPTGTSLHVVNDASTAVIGHVITDSGSVTNATLSAETTKVIGTVNQGTSPWVVSLASTTVTGTVAVTQSTSPWVVSLASTTVTNTVAENLTQVAGVVLGATAVTAFGTAPAAANVPGVNSSLFAGVTGITATGTSLNVNVTNTTAAQPVVGTLTNNNAAPAATNVGALIALANAANPSWTEGDQVLLSEDLSGHLRVVATGTVANGVAATGNPVQVGGVDGNGAARFLGIAAGGGNPILLGQLITGVDAVSNGIINPLSAQAGSTAGLSVAPMVFNGATWDRQRSAGVGNAVASTGLTVAAAYGEYLSTAPAPTTGQYSALQTDSKGSTYVNTEGRKTTYRMSSRAFIPLASASSPTFSIQGSSTKTVRIIHIHISWSCTTGILLANDISLQKFSALTGGTTATTPTAALNDSSNAAQTAVCLQYSVVPSTATVIGGITAVERMSWVTPSLTTYAPNDDIEWIFGNFNEQSLVLRGTSEYFGIVVAVVGASLPLMSLWIEWTEE